MRERLTPLLEALQDALAPIRDAFNRVRTEIAARLRRRRAARAAAQPRARRRPARGSARRDAVGESYASVIAEADDDVASITGRVDTAADMSVVLLVPKAARWMRDASIWPHVAAHARRRGVALSVVSGRRDVRGHAAASGLTTARSISRLTRARRRVRIGERDVVLPPIPWRGLATTVLVAGVLFGIVSVACYAVPSAEIVIVPPSSEFTTTVRARLSPLATEADIASGTLPARNLRVITTATLSVQTTGEAQVPDAAASTTIQFTNDGDAEVSVPAGSRVLDENGVAFTTDEDLDVPAGESASVAATAAEPGLTGNVEAETLRHVDNLPSTVTVTNPSAAAGGTTQSVQGVGEDDLARVREIADEALDLVATRALEREVEDGRVFPQTQNVAIVSETPLAKIGDPAEYLLVEYQIVATALALTSDDLAAYAPEIVRAHLEPGVALLPGTATAHSDSPAELDGGSVVLTIEASGQVTPLFNPEAVGDAITGARPGTAAERLTEMLALVEPPRITIEPSVIPWRWLPRRASRISFVLAAPGSLDEEPDGGDAEPNGTGTGTPTGTPGAATPVPTVTPTADSARAAPARGRPAG